MQTILDTIFASIILIVVALTATAFLIIWLSKTKLFKSKLLNYLFSGFIWEIRQADLHAKDWLNAEPQIHVWTQQNQNLLFNIGGFVYCVDTETGNIIWKNRL